MEWLRWIVLLVGLVVIGGIVWMYRRHRSEQAVDLGGGHPQRGDYHDPIDASVGASEDAEGGRGERREPRIESEDRADDGNGWPRPDADGFIDGASAGRVVRREPADDHGPRSSAEAPASPFRDEPTLESAAGRDEPRVEPSLGEAEPPAEEPPAPDTPPARSQPGFSRLFTRQGQAVGPQGVADEPPAASASADEPVETEAGAQRADSHADSLGGEPGEDAGPASTGAVISMMIVDREQKAMPSERVRRAIEESGFEFGEYSIYHFQDLDGTDWFSLMNAVSPGYFDPDDLSSFETPALALFMQLPVRGGADPSLVFERMHQVATSLADSLDAMLIDDRRQPLDSESIDRYRELIDIHG